MKMKSRRGKRGPDKKKRKPRKIIPIVRVQLSLTPENAEYMRKYADSNSNFVNRLLERHRELFCTAPCDVLISPKRCK